MTIRHTMTIRHAIALFLIGTCSFCLLSASPVRPGGGSVRPAGGAGPAGSDTQIQYNDSGAFAGDADLVWDKTNNRLGVGAAAPTDAIDIDSPEASTGSTAIALRHYASGVASLSMGGAGGTKASPTATTTSTNLGQISGGGYVDGDWTTGKARIRFLSEEAYTTTNQGTKITMATTPTGSTTRTTRVTIKGSGEINLAVIAGDGSGKAVCIKADGDLGTCTDAVGAGGTCTCT